MTPKDNRKDGSSPLNLAGEGGKVNLSAKGREGRLKRLAWNLQDALDNYGTYEPGDTDTADIRSVLADLATQSAHQPSVETAINMAERSLVFWINSAWWGHVAGDARDFRRTTGGIFDQLREDLKLGPLPDIPDDCSTDDVGYVVAATIPALKADLATQSAQLARIAEALKAFAAVYTAADNEEARFKHYRAALTKMRLTEANFRAAARAISEMEK